MLRVRKGRKEREGNGEEKERRLGRGEGGGEEKERRKNYLENF